MGLLSVGVDQRADNSPVAWWDIEFFTRQHGGHSRKTNYNFQGTSKQFLHSLLRNGSW